MAVMFMQSIFLVSYSQSLHRWDGNNSLVKTGCVFFWKESDGILCKMAEYTTYVTYLSSKPASPFKHTQTQGVSVQQLPLRTGKSL